MHVLYVKDLGPTPSAREYVNMHRHKAYSRAKRNAKPKNKQKSHTYNKQKSGQKVNSFCTFFVVETSLFVEVEIEPKFHAYTIFILLWNIFLKNHTKDT